MAFDWTPVEEGESLNASNLDTKFSGVTSEINDLEQFSIFTSLTFLLSYLPPDRLQSEQPLIPIAMCTQGGMIIPTPAALPLRLRAGQ